MHRSASPALLLRQCAAVVLTSACIVSLAACGSSSQATVAATEAGSSQSAASGEVSGGNPTNPPADQHEFQATLEITGAEQQSLTFTESLSVLPACSVLAVTGAQGTWSVPQPSSQTFLLNWNITPYKGPGTYTAKTAFQGSVEVDTPKDQFTPVPKSVLSITVKADGSGSATFQNLQDSTGAAIKGSETWTCS